MSFSITCPYCFGVMKDNEVLFRSEKVNAGECELLPDNFLDTADFIANYHEDDKDEILKGLKDWDFFLEREDEKYEEFWKKFVRTTEVNPADEKLGITPYRRPILDPSVSEHCRFLKIQPDKSFFIRDSDGMVSGIELKTGEVCHRRVCKHCHNPLPAAYGKQPVKFATVVGITGAGKTVYISQLLKNMPDYAANIGLTAVVNTANSRIFLDTNPIHPGMPLPDSTPEGYFQQPVFYQIVRETGENDRVTEMFVLYDVAGEVFVNPDQISRYAPYIEHSDGIVMLLDPLQFKQIHQLNGELQSLDETTAVLTAIHNIVSSGRSEQKCQIPIAVCISKVDLPEVQEVLGAKLCGMLKDDVYGVDSGDGFFLPIFNAERYNPIAKELSDFILHHERALAMQLRTNYSFYAFFAFTALGCEVESGEKENGEPFKYPVGPILPKRIEEPIFWMFYRLGYIGTNEPVTTSAAAKIKCPVCGSEATSPLPAEEQIIKVRRFVWTKPIYVNRVCDNPDCRHKWEYIP